MKSKFHGSCQCGEVTYYLTGEPLMTYACHCKDCQKRTGSAFSMGMVCAITSLKLTGQLSSWTRTSDNGNTNTRYSCENCGNIIYGKSDLSPKLVRLQPGTLDSTGEVTPEVHIWTQNAQHWLNIPDNVISFKTQPDNLSEAFQSAAITSRQK